MSQEAETTQADIDQRLRPTWELELLISGAVVFTLFRVPANLDAALEKLRVFFSQSQLFTSFFFYAYLKMIVFVLIAAFLLHLLARGYWVGLLGLRSVFPQGVVWHELKDGKIFIDELKRLPDLDEQIERTDRLASSIFSFAFLLVYFFMLSVGMVGGFAVISWTISLWLLPGTEIEKIFWVLLALSMVPSTLPSMIDKHYRKKGQEPPPRIAKIIRPVIRGYLRLVLASLYAPILYTLVSNLKGKRAYPLIVVALTALFFGFFVHLEIADREREVVHGYRYLPDRDGELTLDQRFYDNLRRADARHARWPSLSSDVADEPFLKLFLPYIPSRDNDSLETLCKDLKPWPWKLHPDEAPASLDEEQRAVGCLSELYRLELDDLPLTPDFDLYRHPGTGARGLLTYLRTADLEPGRHVLRIEHVDPERDTPRIYHLPFYR